MAWAVEAVCGCTRDAAGVEPPDQLFDRIDLAPAPFALQVGPRRANSLPTGSIETVVIDAEYELIEFPQERTKKSQLLRIA